MDILLKDTNTYEIIKIWSMQKMTENLRTLLTCWKSKSFIDEQLYRSLLLTDGLTPRAYSLPKIHKINHPLRIIVSTINSLLHSLAVFLHKILKNSTKNPISSIKNSYDLVEKLKEVDLTPNLRLASLDVISLFTNIFTEYVINSINKWWKDIKANTNISKTEFTSGIKLIINSTFLN